jgi:glycosyltransferase involved in cell wall biosynthesis
VKVPRVSVIICTLNPKPAYLKRVLDHLKSQTLPKSEWELLLVDNASDQQLVDQFDLSWHPQHIHLRQDQLGLTPSRICGIKQAQGELVVFVDDDNLLAPEYLEQAVEIARTYGFLSVFGAGILQPEFERSPSTDVKRLLPMLGLRSVPRELWSNDPANDFCIPWGAGLCVSRATADSYESLVDSLRIGQVLDRRGETLFGGGDDLFSWASVRRGYGFGIFPKLKVTHIVPSSRVEERYLLRLVRDRAYSGGVLRYTLSGEEQRPIVIVDTIRILLDGLRRGGFSMRCRLAVAQGAQEAARYIATQPVQPRQMLGDLPTAKPIR